jgi:hypothetical protein
MILERIRALPDDLIHYLHEFVHIPYLLDEIKNYKRKEKITLFLGKDGTNGYGWGNKYCLRVIVYQENDTETWKYDTLSHIKQIAYDNGISLPKYSRKKKYIQELMKL